MVIGIMGGIASGKSTIADMLETLGAHVIDADEICHKLINTGSIAQKITARWGNHLKDEHGRIDRQALAEIVFDDKEELLKLNKIIHPEAIKEIEDQIIRFKEDRSTKAIALDAALLVESNLLGICDKTLFVDTQQDICRKRAQNSRNWSLEELTRREQFQDLLQKKRKIADFVINNNGSIADTLKQVKTFWDQIKTEKEIGGYHGNNKDN